MTGTLFGRARGHWRAQLRFDAPTQGSELHQLLWAFIENPAFPAFRGRTSWRPVRRLLFRLDQILPLSKSGKDGPLVYYRRTSRKGQSMRLWLTVIILLVAGALLWEIWS